MDCNARELISGSITKDRGLGALLRSQKYLREQRLLFFIGILSLNNITSYKANQTIMFVSGKGHLPIPQSSLVNMPSIPLANLLCSYVILPVHMLHTTVAK